MDRSGCAGWCGGVWMKAKQPRWSGLYNAGPLGGGARWSQKSAYRLLVAVALLGAMETWKTLLRDGHE
jgi:hypothetical protein